MIEPKAPEVARPARIRSDPGDLDPNWHLMSAIVDEAFEEGCIVREIAAPLRNVSVAESDDCPFLPGQRVLE
jgi:hypothetical protein